MKKIHLIIFILLGIIMTIWPSQVLADNNNDEVNVKELVFGHINDSYEWHIVSFNNKSISIPLPVIVKSNDGWQIFSSEKLKDGKSYNGLYISKEGIYENKIVEKNADGSITRPLDISITKNVVGMLINSCILVCIILICANWYKKHPYKEGAPKGGIGIIEALTLNIYNDVIKGGIGDGYQKYAPYLLSAFYFILINNIMGLVPFFPGGANITGNIAVTFVLALCTFLYTSFSGTKTYWKEIFWPEVPTWLKAPIPIMPLIEFLGIFTKPIALMVRLFANIMAGHAAILSIISIIFITVKSGPIINGSMTVTSVIFGVMMDTLEVLVAFIQAYVFTMLSSVFIGLARVNEE